jgi:glycosyltransferase involved in cell wall biosynthesis
MNGVRAETPERVTLVLGTVAGGTGVHVKTVVTGLAGRGVGVAVAGPSAADARFSFSAVPSVSFAAVEISPRPRAADLANILRLRRLLVRARSGGPGGGGSRSPGGGPARESPGETGPARRWPRGHGRSPGGGHVVHAHGVRAGALTVLALVLVRGGRPGLVVTVHNAPGGGASGLVYRLLERIVARGADLVLCVSPDLERRMRAARAHRVERAVIAAPDIGSGPAASPPPATAAHGQKAAASSAVTTSAGKAASARASDASGPARAGSAPGAAITRLAGSSSAGAVPGNRPVVLAVGRLAAQKGFGVLLEAAAAWRDLDPVPLVVIAGDGPLAGALRARAAELGLDVLFPGHRDDVPALLAAAAVFVLPSRWEGQPLVLQQALRAGAPVVATRVGGVPVLAGQDAALLVPPGDVRALAAAVRSVLTDPALAPRLRAAAAARAATLPTEADAVTAAVDAYASVLPGDGR